MRNEFFRVILLFLSINSCSYAFTPWLLNPHLVLTGGIGTLISNDIGNSKTFPIQNPSTDEFYDYTANHSNQSYALFDGFAGVESEFNRDWLLQTGLGYNQSTTMIAKGTFTQGTDIASANTYNYYYSVLVRQLLLEAKALYSLKQYYHPYIMAGLGLSFNKAYNYYTSASSFLTFTRMYANHSITSPSYMLGFGVDADVAKCLRLGVGYRFANLGKVKLGPAVIDSVAVSGTLSQSQLYANEIMVQLTYIMS